jgi:hypothetical protein
MTATILPPPVTERLVLGVDELRAAARLAGVPVPFLVAADDPHDPRVDLAALRGLAARGLVTGLEAADPEPAGPLATVVDALVEPELVLEVERDGGRDTLQAEGQGGGLTLTALPGGLVEVGLGAPPTGHEGLDELLGLAPPVADVPLVGVVEFEVPVSVHVEADELVLAGDAEAAVALLSGSGVAHPTAVRWTAAVAGRRGATALRVARRRNGVVVGHELRWLVAGDGAIWLVDAGDEREGAATSRVRRVGAAELRAALDELRAVISDRSDGEDDGARR